MVGYINYHKKNKNAHKIAKNPIKCIKNNSKLMFTTNRAEGVGGSGTSRGGYM